jgi:uncharacterized protein
VKVDKITGDVFFKMIQGATDLLKANKGAVDALNVFPVPDGDTGTNMSLTMLSAVTEATSRPHVSLAQVAEAVALGSLMGARGNSGVILSQLFRGIARGLAGHDEADGATVAEALQEGVVTAYKAVMKPVEGTILTVAKEAARGASTAVARGGGAADAWRAASRAAETALARTPEMLPVLKAAKVVDAGGKGLCFILTGALEVLVAGSTVMTDVAPDGSLSSPEFVITEEMGNIEYPYDVQLLVRGTAISIDDLRTELVLLGDSLLVVGAKDVARVHVHTSQPDAVLGICMKYGSLSRVTIDDMKEQHEELKASLGVVAREPESEDQPKEVGVVAVASGKGVIEVMKSLGADMVIDGGQTMNPSTEDVVNAVNSIYAKRVIFIPNNGNIIMAAKQAKRISERRMWVVPTKTVPQGIAALLVVRPDANMETNLKRMAKAVKQVKTGEITFAVRKSQFSGFSIKEGDVLGLIEGDLAVTGEKPADVLLQVLDKMVAPEDEVITIFYGNGMTEADAMEPAAAIREKFPNCELEIRAGDQPLYFYIVSVE